MRRILRSSAGAFGVRLHLGSGRWWPQASASRRSPDPRMFFTTPRCVPTRRRTRGSPHAKLLDQGSSLSDSMPPPVCRKESVLRRHDRIGYSRRLLKKREDRRGNGHCGALLLRISIRREC